MKKSLFSPYSIITLLLFSLCTVFFISSCKPKPKAAYPKIDPGFGSYVYAYSSGVISKKDPLVIKLNEAAAEAADIGKEVDGNVISLSPSASGTAVWEDERTIKFTPSSHLKEDTEYKVSIKLSKLYSDVPSKLATFEYFFRTKKQDFSVVIDGLVTPDVSNLNKQQLEGKINTADFADNEAVEQMLSFSQPGNNQLKINWTHLGDQEIHQFTIDNVVRASKSSKIDLSWDGKPIGVRLNDKKEVEVPALGDFKVLDAKVVRGTEQYVLAKFSDPLKEDQELKGLVSINGVNDSKYRFSIDGNELRVYPGTQIQGAKDVRFRIGIRNSQSLKMEKAGSWSLTFSSLPPKIKLVGKGVVMPGDDGLIFPFDAVNLTAIDVEVFKIFQNNVLQFFQSNDYNGDYDFYRIGRVVHQEKVPLNTLSASANTADWTRYALDLSKMTKTDPGAIYQVRLSFREEYRAYSCDGEEEKDQLEHMPTNTKIDGEELISYWDNSYRYYDYPGYKWEHRRDPCFPPYYTSRNWVKRNVFASNIGIIGKRGTDGNLMVAVTNLLTAEPIAGATIEVYDYQQQSLGSFKADSDGILFTEMKRMPFAISVKNGDQVGYLKLSDGASNSLSKFEVSGASTQKGLKGYIYGERGVWRPGDSIYLNFILQDKQNKLPGNHPVTFKFKDPKGQLQQTLTRTKHKKHVYSFKTATSQEAPTGNWSAVIEVGGAKFYKNIRVETVKPNRLKLNIDFGKQILQASDKDLNGTVKVNWLHGAPAKGVRTEIKMEMKPIPTRFKSYDDFVFDDPARSFSVEPKTIFDGKVNDEGYTTFNSKLNTNDQVPGKMKVFFSARAFESGGDFSSDNFAMEFNPYESYVGVQIPKNRYNSKRFDIGKNNRIEVMVVDTDGKPIKNKKLNVGIYRVDWRWWWERSSNNLGKYNSTNHLNSITKTEVTSDSNGNAVWSVKPEGWGRYMIRVCDPESGHCSGDFAYAGSPWDDENGGNREGASMLAFSSDKQKYAVGETVTLKIPTGQEGKALVSIENGTRVLETYWVNAKKGETTFQFYATEAMAPNVYAHVTLIQPHGQVKNDLPVRMYGVIPIYIEDPNTRIEPQIVMNDILKPEENYTIQVKEKSGRAMAYTIAVVDEGLLDLTRFKTPDPWNTFYAKEALGVKSWDMYDYVLGAYGGDLERIMAIGGDANVKPKNAKKANRFKPVVSFLGPFELKKGAKATHELTMANYVGSVRTMVVAAHEGAYGNAEKTTPVRKPLMVLATLPRVLGPAETVKLPVTVFAMEKKVKDVTVKIEPNSLFEIIGPATQNVRFDKPDEKVVTFNLKVTKGIGIGKVKVITSGGGETATQDIELDVRNPNPKVTDVAARVLEKGETWNEEFKLVGTTGTNSGILEVSSIPPLNLGRRMQYLIRYPHGCIEQTTSAAFPQLFAGRMLDLTDNQKKEAEFNIKEAINRIKRFQIGSGGLAYWPGDSYVSYWGSNYAGHFLIEAKIAGYNVPESLINNLINFQRKTVRSWRAEEYPYKWGRRGNVYLVQSYRLYMLALAKAPELGAMNRMREIKDLPATAKWRLAASYVLAGKPEVAKEIIRGLNTEVQAYRELSYTYGSDLRDRAMILETLVLLDDRKRAAEVMKQISDQLSSNSWHSTQTVSYCLLACGKFVGEKDLSKKFSFTYNLGSASPVNAGSDKAVVQVPIGVDALSNKSISVKNTTDGILFARLVLQGQPTIGDQTKAANKLVMKVNFLDLKGDTININKLEQGTDFIAQVRLKNPGLHGRYNEMALSQIFPSGWEIHNTRMNNISSNLKASTPEYQDIRDDRVYSYFDIRPTEEQVYNVQLNAAYVGKYYLPSTYCEAMYDNTINARQPGQWVEVFRPGN